MFCQFVSYRFYDIPNVVMGSHKGNIFSSTYIVYACEVIFFCVFLRNCFVRISPNSSKELRMFSAKFSVLIKYRSYLLHLFKNCPDQLINLTAKSDSHVCCKQLII